MGTYAVPSTRPDPKPLCLVGMSGIGKSHAARLLSAEGFRWYDCDRRIAERLHELVAPLPGEEPVHALGRWMGMPWSEGYAEREARYLALETAVTTEVIATVAASEAAPTVVDTTGSVIYLDEKVLADLRRTTHVVYLAAQPSDRAALLALYLQEPKPVVWAGAYYERPGEDHGEALARSYSELLADRDRRYRALAARVLPASKLRVSEEAQRQVLRGLVSFTE
ncbi:MAG: hypothetical protein AAGF12_31630 [Myxococcota bacterium]